MIALTLLHQSQNPLPHSSSLAGSESANWSCATAHVLPTSCSLTRADGALHAPQVFDHKEQMNDPEGRIALMRQEASAIIEAFFSGGRRQQSGAGQGEGRGAGRGEVRASARGRGREARVGARGGGGARGQRRGLHDDDDVDNWGGRGGAGGMIDDDYELAVATQRGFDAMQEEAFPDLAPSTYAGPAADWVPRIAPSVAGPVTASFSTDGMRLEWKLMSLAPARTARHDTAVHDNTHARARVRTQTRASVRADTQ